MTDATPANYEFLEILAICKGDSFDEQNNLTHAEAYQRALQIYKLQQEKYNMNIITGKIKKAQKIIVYGEPGAGKSSLASKFPKVLLVDVEHSSEHIDVPRVIVDDWKSLLKILDECKTSEFDTIAVDTLDVVEKFCATEYQIKILAPKDYGRSFVALEEAFNENILPRLDAIVASGKNVLLLAHNELKKVELPDQDGQFDRHEMRLTKRVKALFEGWCDCLLFIYRKTFVEESDSGKNKAKGGKKRWLESNSNTFCIAKTRWVGLEDNFEVDVKKLLPFVSKSGEGEKPAEPQTQKEPETPRTPQQKLADLLALGKFSQEEMLAYLYGKNKKAKAFVAAGTEFDAIPAELIERMTTPENWERVEVSLQANR